MSRSFSIKNFGCRATQADGAGIAADLATKGLLPSEDPYSSDVVVVNTCTVTAEADRDARHAIRRIHRENPGAEILVTGCYAQRSPETLSALDGVKWVVGNSHKHDIARVVAPGLVQIRESDTQSLSYHGEIASGGSLVGDISRLSTLPVMPSDAPLGRSRPNVKVQDGCNNRCSFCIIPSVRGRSRSAPIESVIREVRRLQDNYAEIVLTGINLGRWGRDLQGGLQFPELLEALLSDTDVQKIRLSSVEPMDWSDRLLKLMAESPRIAKHVHMPLQSGSDSVLRRMRRRYRVRHYENRLTLARDAMPQAAIGADVMVGFPGESDGEFEATRAFIERMPFTYLHVFSYSSRDGTEAAELDGQVPKTVKKERNRVLRDLISSKNLRFRERLIGTTGSAVTLSRNPETVRALTDNFIEIHLDGSTLPPGRLVAVRVDAVEVQRTTGTVVT